MIGDPDPVEAGSFDVAGTANELLGRVVRGEQDAQS
jgi:hypothetical protein